MDEIVELLMRLNQNPKDPDAHDDILELWTSMPACNEQLHGPLTRLLGDLLGVFPDPRCRSLRPTPTQLAAHVRDMTGDMEAGDVRYVHLAWIGSDGIHTHSAGTAEFQEQAGVLLIAQHDLFEAARGDG